MKWKCGDPTWTSFIIFVSSIFWAKFGISFNTTSNFILVEEDVESAMVSVKLEPSVSSNKHRVLLAS